MDHKEFNRKTVRPLLPIYLKNDPTLLQEAIGEPAPPPTELTLKCDNSKTDSCVITNWPSEYSLDDENLEFILVVIKRAGRVSINMVHKSPSGKRVILSHVCVPPGETWSATLLGVDLASGNPYEMNGPDFSQFVFSAFYLWKYGEN